MATSKKRLGDITNMVEDRGVDETATTLGISRETVRRAVRSIKNEYQKKETKTFTESEARQYKEFCERFTPAERAAILSGSSLRPQEIKSSITFDCDEITVGVFTDPHMGAEHFSERYWDAMLNEFVRRGVHFAVCAGDLTEGMSNRPDHIYHLTHIGYSAQMEYAVSLLSQLPCPLKIIDGNHDRWGIKNGGLQVVKEIARQLPNVEFLGNDYGSFLVNGTSWMLIHGDDGGGSYAYSYRPQKIVEAFKGGHKPQVLITGHDHKHGYFFPRLVHTIMGGALCKQSEWMRSTRKENHDGFWTLKAGIADKEIKYMEPRWYPFYE